MSYCFFQCPYCGKLGDGTRGFAEHTWDEERCTDSNCGKTYYVRIIVRKEKEY